MPYSLSDDGLCVVKKDTGEQIKCYDNHADALAYQRALEVNVHDSKGVIQSAEDELDVLVHPFTGHIKGKLDAHGQYFSPQTNFHEDLIKSPPVTKYHNFDDTGNPIGQPESIGTPIKRWMDDNGVWYRLKMDTTKVAAKEAIEGAKKGETVASSTTLKPFHRVNRQTGHIDDWLTGEISVWKLDPQRTMLPANQRAIALPAMKSIYQTIGFNDYNDDEMKSAMKQMGGSSMPTSVKELLHWLMSAMMLDNGEDEVKNDVGDETPNPRLPRSKPEEDKLNQEEMKAVTDQNTKLQSELATMKAAFNKQEAEGWATSQVQAFKLLPAEKAAHVEMYVQLKTDDDAHKDETMKFASGSATRLAQFKVMVESREAHKLTEETMKAASLLGNDTPKMPEVNAARVSESIKAARAAMGMYVGNQYQKKGVNQ